MDRFLEAFYTVSKEEREAFCQDMAKGMCDIFRSIAREEIEKAFNKVNKSAIDKEAEK